MDAMITLRVSKQFKEALKEYAKTENKSLSDVILTILRERLEDDEDYRDAVLILESLKEDDLMSAEEFYNACGLDYHAL